MSTSISPDPIGIFDPAIRPDPYPLYASLLESGRVAHDPGSGTWFLFGYDHCAFALKETGTFSADRATPDQPGDLPSRGRSMLRSDPPDHTRIRNTVGRAFTPRAMAALEPRITEIARRLLQPLETGRPFDVVGGLAVPLPVMIIAELLGVAAEDWPQFRRWSESVISVARRRTARSAAIGTIDAEVREAAVRSQRELRGYFARVIEERRREPRDDLISRMVAANEDGVLSADELMNACVLLLLAGNETTTNLISNMARALAGHLEQRRRLVHDPTVIGNAVEEVMRFDGPVQFTSRRTTQDVSLTDQTIPAQSFVLVVLASANRDPAYFPDPHAFDVGREDAASHLGFGRGIHYCLGAPQARLEARIAFELLLERAPDFALAHPGRAFAYGPNASLRGLRELWIVPGLSA